MAAQGLAAHGLAKPTRTKERTKARESKRKKGIEWLLRDRMVTTSGLQEKKKVVGNNLMADEDLLIKSK